MKQYKARDKITQKMTRDGAIEVNAATGKQSVSANGAGSCPAENAGATGGAGRTGSTAPTGQSRPGYFP